MISKLLKKISLKYASKWLVLLFDVVIVILTFFASYFIRYNFKLDFDLVVIFKQMPLVAIIAIISFILVGSHKGVVRYTGFRDVVNIIIGANILATVLLITTVVSKTFQINNVLEFSGSIIYIHLLLNFLFLIGAKFFVKSVYHSIVRDKQNIKNVLIYGAGTSGLITYDALTNDTKTNNQVVGFIDDNTSKVGKKMNLLPVYNIENIEKKFLNKNKIDEVIISIQSIGPKRLLDITSYLIKHNLKVKIVATFLNR